MYAQVEKPKENKSSAVANTIAQNKSNVKQVLGFVDNRSEAVAQRKLQQKQGSAKPTIQMDKVSGKVQDAYNPKVENDFSLKEHGIFSTRNKVTDEYMRIMASALVEAKRLVRATINKLMGKQTEDDYAAFRWCFSNSLFETVVIVNSVFCQIINGLNANGIVIEDKQTMSGSGDNVHGYVPTKGIGQLLFGMNIHIDFSNKNVHSLAYTLIHEASHAFAGTADMAYLGSNWKGQKQEKEMNDLMRQQGITDNLLSDEQLLKKYPPVGGEGTTKERATTNNADSYSLFAFIVNGKAIP